MNKIKNAIDDIKISERDKNKIYNNIIEKNMQKHSLFNFNAVIRFATIVIAIGIFSYTSVYAAAKIFNWNNKFLDFLGISNEQAETNNLKNTNIEKTIKIDNMDITINQAAIFGEHMYIYLDYQFDDLDQNITLDKLNDNLISLSIETDEEELFGNHDFISLDLENKKATAIADIFIEDKIQNGSELQIVFNTDFVIENLESGGTVGSFTTHNSIKWKAEVIQNQEYIVDNFNKEVYLKNNDVIKIQPTKLRITPIDIHLDLNIYTDIEFPDEEVIKFDNTLDINFKDGTTIKLNSTYDDEKTVMGSNILGTDEEDSNIRTMHLSYSNIYNNDFFTKYDAGFITIEDIESIQIGDYVITK